MEAARIGRPLTLYLAVPGLQYQVARVSYEILFALPEPLTQVLMADLMILSDIDLRKLTSCKTLERITKELREHWPRTACSSGPKRKSPMQPHTDLNKVRLVLWRDDAMSNEEVDQDRS